LRLGHLASLPRGHAAIILLRQPRRAAVDEAPVRLPAEPRHVLDILDANGTALLAPLTAFGAAFLALEIALLAALGSFEIARVAATAAPGLVARALTDTLLLLPRPLLLALCEFAATLNIPAPTALGVPAAATTTVATVGLLAAAATAVAAEGLAAATAALLGALGLAASATSTAAAVFLALSAALIIPICKSGRR
jgi:hypothetical protein